MGCVASNANANELDNDVVMLANQVGYGKSDGGTTDERSILKAPSPKYLGPLTGSNDVLSFTRFNKVDKIDIAGAANTMDSANKQQTSAALIIEAYCNSVLAQPSLDLTDLKEVEDLEDTINNGLKIAQGHANDYLNIIQPAIIQNMSNMSDYYALHKAVATTLPPDSTEEHWESVLFSLKKQANIYENQSLQVVHLLQTLHNNLTRDYDSFSRTVIELNNAIKGSNGELSALRKEVSSVQSKIDGVIAGVVVSGLAIVGGSFLICVGAISDWITAGTTTPAVIGGIGMVVSGVGGEVGSAVSLAQLIREKSDLLSEKSSLQADIKTVTGIEVGYQSLANQINSAIGAAQDMQNAWSNLGDQLGTMASDLTNGLITINNVRKSFLTDANSAVTQVIKDISTIKQQMAGVKTAETPKNETLGDFIVNSAKNGKNSDINSMSRNILLNKYKTTSVASYLPMAPKTGSSNAALTTSTPTAVNKANKQQVGQAIIIQNYCNSIKAQPKISLSGVKALDKYQKQVNSGLSTAQSHATNYLNNIQPNIIKNMDNIENYYQLHNAVPVACPPGSTAAQWVTMLKTLKKQATAYEKDAKSIVTTLGALNTQLTHDEAAFASIVVNMNNAVNGSTGTLASINSQLKSIQKRIDGAIAGTVIAGLAIAGGAIVAAVGAVTDVFDGGATTPLVAGGIAIVGAAGEAGAAVALEKLNDDKANLLTEKSNLQAEVKLATSVSTAYGSFKSQIAQAVTAATAMKNAWSSLKGDLTNYVSDLQKGIKTPAALRTLWLTTANGAVKTILTDITNIKAQLAGVTNITATGKGQNVGEAIVKAVQGGSGGSGGSSSTLGPATGASLVSLGSIGSHSSGNGSASGSGSGVLSQTIAHLRTAETNILSLGGLPRAAVSIQQQSSSVVRNVIAQVVTIQDNVKQFTPWAGQQLQSILQMLPNISSDPSTLTTIKNKMSEISDSGNVLKTNVTTNSNSIIGDKSVIDGYFQQIATIETNLTSQQTSLRGHLNNAQSEEESTKKKYYYLLALGPLGMAGLAAALALYEHWQSEVDSLQNEVNSLNSQISAITAMKTHCSTMSTSFLTVINKVQAVINDVDIVSNDILNIGDDLNSSTAALFAYAAIHEVNTLNSDAA